MKQFFSFLLFCTIGLQLVSAQNYDYKPVATKITANASTKMQKVKAIYDWICNNIQYDTSYKIYHADECYKQRKGVCQAYSELMRYMCEAVGVQCTIISGTSYHMYGGGAHAWICAQVEKGTILIDPTWGAGSVNGSTFTFKKDHDYWFDVDPYWMIFTHFPEDPKYQFLQSPISAETFNKMPRIDPSCKYLGWNAKDIFSKWLRKEVTSFPTFYGADFRVIQLADIPISRKLRVGTTYKFRMKVSDPSRIAIINGNDWYQSSQWTHESGYSTIYITPRVAGKLSINYRGDDGWYSGMIEYDVQ